MSISDEIIECEIEYSKCFSKTYENKNIIRFRDDQLKDMYDHNYAYIKNPIDQIKLKDIIENEISLRILEKSNFCNIVLNFDISRPIFSTLDFNPKISTNGYYTFDIAKISKLNYLQECTIKKVINQKMLEDILFCNLKYEEETLGKDFSTRKTYRLGKVYLSDKNLDSYICYHKGDIIGKCDLFIHNGVAKIEDFLVIPSYQRKGYGTSILKALIDISIENKAHTIYLLADEYDTAKEMYEKISFEKIGERTDLFFELQ